MEQDELKKLIEERMVQLPDVIRDAIVSSGWENTIREIVRKFNLRIDQGSSIETETFLVMLGIENKDQYLENIIKEAKIDKDTAQKITSEVSQKIFSLIKENIIKKTEEKEQEPDRESILKEIEKDEENETELAIPAQPSVPSTQVNTMEQNQKIVEQDLKNTATNAGATNTVAQKLQTPSVSEPKVVKIDPYRESF